MVHTWPRPYYWDYGPGHYIYYDDGAIYVNGRWYAPAPVYYEQTVELAQRVPDLTEEQAREMEWLPLGVFAVVEEGAEEFHLMVQVAVSEDGILGGTVFDEAAGEGYPLEGTVDEETQRAVWTYTDAEGNEILMETSIFNLTREETTALVHLSPERLEVRQLIRLEPPDEEGLPAGAVEGDRAAGRLP